MTLKLGCLFKRVSHVTILKGVGRDTMNGRCISIVDTCFSTKNTISHL